MWNNTIECMMKQIRVGELSRITGAYNCSYSNKGNYIVFMFKMCRKANVCQIKYDEGMDLYAMTFKRVSKTELKVVEEFDGLYYDQLSEVFEKFTGLDTKLPKIIMKEEE